MSPRDRLSTLAQWVGLGAVTGVLCGAASALFLDLLERATRFRTGHETIVEVAPETSTCSQRRALSP